VAVIALLFGLALDPGIRGIDRRVAGHDDSLRVLRSQPPQRFYLRGFASVIRPAARSADRPERVL